MKLNGGRINKSCRLPSRPNSAPWDARGVVYGVQLNRRVQRRGGRGCRKFLRELQALDVEQDAGSNNRGDTAVRQIRDQSLIILPRSLTQGLD